MSRPSILAFLASFFLYLALVNALPVGLGRSDTLVRRQNGQGTSNSSDPNKLTTVQTTQTPIGPMVQTCTITLTPITDVNGNPAVREVKNCTMALGNNPAGGSDPGPNNPPPPNPTPPGGTSSSTSSSLTSSTLTLPPTSTKATAPTTSAISTEAPPAVVNGFTTVSAPPTPTPEAGSPATSAAAPNNAASTTAPSAAGAAAAAAAADNSSAAATPTQATFALPGKKLAVLPIGLAVFAGISVIALIVVGLVTYERTKYRKAFRQRKLAEAGTTMGYGGMAQLP